MRCDLSMRGGFTLNIQPGGKSNRGGIIYTPKQAPPGEINVVPAQSTSRGGVGGQRRLPYSPIVPKATHPDTRRSFGRLSDDNIDDHMSHQYRVNTCVLSRIFRAEILQYTPASHMTLPSRPTQLPPSPLCSSPTPLSSRWIFFPLRRLRSCAGILYVLPLRIGRACDVPGSCGSNAVHGSIG